MYDENRNEIRLDDTAIAQLTVNHLNTMVEVDGAFYMPGGGIMRDGTSARALRNADKMTNETTMAQLYYEQNAAQLQTEIENALASWGRPIPQKFDIHFDYVPELERFAIVERTSTVFLITKMGNYFYHNKGTASFKRSSPFVSVRRESPF